MLLQPDNLRNILRKKKMSSVSVLKLNQLILVILARDRNQVQKTQKKLSLRWHC